jgi:glycerophosphoryl diester phosphodiesterase
MRGIRWRRNFRRLFRVAENLSVTVKEFSQENAGPIVIAHRGASGYLPEHTLEAKALAIGMGADFVEQDIVITKDGAPIVTHDIFLEDVTDIAARFSGRGRGDGHYYAIDFTVGELKTLSRHERVDNDGNTVFPGRFPRTSCRFAVITLSEEIEFVKGINKSAGRNVGLYTEVKFPAWHRAQGQDVTRITLDTLARHGYTRRGDNVYFQCFDALELKRVRGDLGCDLKLIQLIGENAWNESTTDYDAMRTDRGLADVATYADGIGPEITQLVEWTLPGAPPTMKTLGALAKSHGLRIHPYTFRTDQLPPSAPDPVSVLNALFDQVKVDGIFSDFTDFVVDYRNARGDRKAITPPT